MGIEIKHGIGCEECEFINDVGCCAFKWHIYSNGNPLPGPSCRPGVYELVPEGEMEAAENAAKMHADINRAVATALGQGVGETWHDLGDKVRALKAENERLRKMIFDCDILQELHLSRMNHWLHVIECEQGKIIGGAPEESQSIIAKIDEIQKEARAALEVKP